MQKAESTVYEVCKHFPLSLLESFKKTGKLTEEMKMTIIEALEKALAAV
jgi:hypothetical protein